MGGAGFAVSGNQNLLNFNGGTIEPAVNSLTLVPNTFTAATVYNGGAIINTNGYTATVAAKLSAAAGDGIYPSGGSIALSSGSGGGGYIGALIVILADSSGSGSGATANATITNGAISGVTLTCPGQGYLPGDILTFSFSGGGALTPAGTYQYTLQPGDVAANGTGGVTKPAAAT